LHPDEWPGSLCESVEPLAWDPLRSDNPPETARAAAECLQKWNQFLPGRWKAANHEKTIAVGPVPGGERPGRNRNQERVVPLAAKRKRLFWEARFTAAPPQPERPAVEGQPARAESQLPQPVAHLDAITAPAVLPQFHRASVEVGRLRVPQARLGDHHAL